ncbi:aminopeptidase N-like [Planococcus citri]|uniref:aminopeptidase N-like n=1 Tax=Planococcus citri TaxID=170843 RepID=UPI0031F88E96
MFSNTQPMTWLTTSEPMQLEERVLNTDWILFNVQHSGYYRVNYDTENWYLLIDQLQQDHRKIHVLNRAQLIDDAFALAYDEHLSYAIALKLADYLPKETEMIPWYAAIKAFNRLRLKLHDSPNYEFFQSYLRNLAKNSIKIFKFRMSLTDYHIERIVKPQFLMLACEMGIEDCIENSLNEYNSHKDNLVNVQPDLNDVVFCHALINSKDQQTVFINLWNEYTKSKIPFEKTQILTALSCASDEGVIRNILTKMTNPNNKEIQKQDRSYFLTPLATRMSGITAALRFAIGETETINRMEDGISFFKDLLRPMENNIRSQYQVEQLKNLENALNLLDENKYGEIISIIKHLQSTSASTINYNAQKLDRMQKESSQSEADTKVIPSKPVQPSDQPSNSGAAITIFNFKLQLVLVGVATYMLNNF